MLYFKIFKIITDQAANMKKAFKNHKESNFNSTSTSSPDIIDITTLMLDEAYEKEKLELDKISQKIFRRSCLVRVC